MSDEQHNSTQVDMETQETADVADGNPKVLDLSTVMAMFTKLDEKVSSLQNNLEDLKARKPKQLIKEDEELIEENTKKVEEVEKRISQCERGAAATSEVSALKREMSRVKHQNKVMSGTVQRLYDIVDDLSVKIENLEVSANKRSITLSGLQIDKKEGLLDITDFFKQIFEFKPDIEDYYVKGNNTPPLIVITFQYLSEKKLVMQNKGILKNYKSEKGDLFYINDFLPAYTNEKKKER